MYVCMHACMSTYKHAFIQPYMHVQHANFNTVLKTISFTLITNLRDREFVVK